ncbi:MAG: DUF134 domain-containing protein [Lentisphaerae bacterium]|jgi:predicted DNA-binding protein (UPF0251 family)|nr:DUF134 domain-containing protein [Lentisphaerota bacterium]
MSRPVQTRRIEFVPRANFFKPVGVPRVDLEEVTLTLDELEALRLADLNDLYQEEAATRMDISRSAFARTLQSARQKVADALTHGKSLRMEGGPVKADAIPAGICPGDCPCRQHRHRGRGGWRR